MIHSHLHHELLALIHEAENKELTLLLGGGLALLEKQNYLESKTNWHIKTVIDREFWGPARTTNDIDIYLTIEFMSNAENIKGLKAILADRGYSSVESARYFQFEKNVEGVDIRVDILTGKPSSEDNLEVKSIRVKNKGAKKFHAHISNDALFLETPPEEIQTDGGPLKIVNSLTLLVVKIHAYSDNLSNQQKDYGRHHAVDIYRIVAMLTEQELSNCKTLLEACTDQDQLESVMQILNNSFNEEDAAGCIAIKERMKASAIKPNIEAFLEALSYLFRS